MRQRMFDLMLFNNVDTSRKMEIAYAQDDSFVSLHRILFVTQEEFVVVEERTAQLVGRCRFIHLTAHANTRVGNFTLDI